MSVCIFTLSNCSHCNKLKKRLEIENIKFIEYDSDEYIPLIDQITKQMGEINYPTIFIKRKNSNDGVILIPGVNVDDEDEMIEKIKKNM
jgi:glutaredoxin|tara:strand:- start:4987 stop:5253 length:267 start_codon:yes stop_codon:yes gene_type:complete